MTGTVRGVPSPDDALALPAPEAPAPATPSVLHLLRSWRAVTFAEITGEGSIQRQMLYPGVCWGASISAGWVVMPPGHLALPHVHDYTDLIVTVVAGWVETLIWHPAEGEIRSVSHGPGDMILIPAGWGHIGVNLSRSQPVVLAEFRNDPLFSQDVTRLEDYDEQIHALARRHQQQWQQPDEPYTVVDRLLA